jgi:hypothetical protein
LRPFAGPGQPIITLLIITHDSEMDVQWMYVPLSPTRERGCKSCAARLPSRAVIRPQLLSALALLGNTDVLHNSAFIVHLLLSNSAW